MKYLGFFLLLLFMTACSGDEGKVFDNELEEIDEYISAKGWDAIETDSGLHYVIVEAGTGTAMPVATSEVEVTYRGEFLDGDIFDQSLDAIEFPLNGVIAGWTEGLQLMKKDAVHYLIVPSRLAYGESGRNTIPGNTPLFFEVKLLGWK